MKLQISKPLAVSVALNLVLAGYLIGNYTRQFTVPRFGPPPIPGIPFGQPPEWLRALPEEKADRVRDTFAQIIRDKEAQFAEMQGAQAKLRKIIAAKHFDENALRAALEALMLEREVTQQQAIERFVVLLRDFTPEERMALARGLDHPLPFGGPLLFMHKRAIHTGPVPADGSPREMPPY